MTDAQAAPAAQHVNFSKFATTASPTVDVPMAVINRPVPSQLDEDKVLRFMEDIKVRPGQIQARRKRADLSLASPPSLPSATTPGLFLTAPSAVNWQKGDDFTPIEVLRCVAPDGQKYFFAFGGCHRYEAHKRLKSETIPGRIINVPPSAIRMYLGASAPF
ncbi:Sulfiredoxin [Rhodotorula toruloides ATCC 204091]|uniref:Sulfiredoxin n=1 Tax=Rhodotorula toruloides TaxID=5286 RepID=A0A0K3CAY9_RHOTO|nr:Sulfiredoxin [Rhodotorula toruloides ATCC 204091]PRQ75094.1 sulfiredoxin [Rhodotorula toruloides]